MVANLLNYYYSKYSPIFLLAIWGTTVWHNTTNRHNTSATLAAHSRIIHNTTTTLIYECTGGERVGLLLGIQAGWDGFHVRPGEAYPPGGR